ncbi:MAG: protein kinase [Acidobacteriota bacterium]
MTLEAGSKLGPYEIVAPLGAGGMGEVYRARDPRLEREVAIKVLPDVLAQDTERLARFGREAQVLASLNHPNIASIYGLEEADGHSALVMELVEGETLSDRLKRGALPIPEATRYALQIATALEEAHGQGIIHRDLKPGNIIITPKNQVKVLDFGLAKALEGDPTASGSAPSMTQSPTLTAQMTGAGVLLGTAAYMSPEQARGEPADRRADIWAFGVVLMEMLTGTLVYSGKTVSDTLAGVLAREPEWDSLPAATPPSVRRLIERCLEKETEERLQAIGEARIALEHYLEDPDADVAPVAAGVAVPKWKLALPWALAALLAIALGLTLWRLWPDEQVLKANIPPPDGTVFHLSLFDPGPAVVSPDGLKIAFSARNADGVTQLYVRELASIQAHAISDSDGAQYPFWSPDSEWVAFFTKEDNKLKKVKGAGGTPLPLSDSVDGKGGSWSKQGVIIFAPGPFDPIHRVPAAGGPSTPITVLDSENFNSHRQPRFLSDGNRFIFVARGENTAKSKLMLASLDDPKTLHEVADQSTQGEVVDGRMFFVRDSTLLSQPFDEDAGRLVEEPVPLGEGIIADASASIAMFSVSPSGYLTYHTGEAETGVSMQWFDRAGGRLGTLGDVAGYRLVSISPDNQFVAATVMDADEGNYDIWLLEVERNVRSRFTFSAKEDTDPVWMPDSSAVIFGSDRNDQPGIYRKAIGGSDEVELLFETETFATPTGVSADGKLVFYMLEGEDTTWDIWTLELSDPPEAKLFLQTEFLEGGAQLSPDGRWVAYYSNESGQFEVYIKPFPGPGRRWQVATETGAYFYWASGGNEIVYQSTEDGSLLSAQVTPQEGGLRVSRPELLFSIDPGEAGGPRFAVSADGQRILTIPLETTQSNNLLNLVVNWPEELRRR